MSTKMDLQLEKLRRDIQDDIIIYGTCEVPEPEPRKKCSRCDARFVVDDFEDVGVTVCPDCKRSMSPRQLTAVRAAEKSLADRVRARHRAEFEKRRREHRQREAKRHTEAQQAEERRAAERAKQEHVRVNTRPLALTVEKSIPTLVACGTFVYVYFYHSWHGLLSLVITGFAVVLAGYPLGMLIGEAVGDVRIGRKLHNSTVFTSRALTLATLLYNPVMWTMDFVDYRSRLAVSQAETLRRVSEKHTAAPVPPAAGARARNAQGRMTSTIKKRRNRSRRAKQEGPQAR